MGPPSLRPRTRINRFPLGDEDRFIESPSSQAILLLVLLILCSVRIVSVARFYSTPPPSSLLSFPFNRERDQRGFLTLCPFVFILPCSPPSPSTEDVLVIRFNHLPFCRITFHLRWGGTALGDSGRSGKRPRNPDRHPIVNDQYIRFHSVHPIRESCILQAVYRQDLELRR